MGTLAQGPGGTLYGVTTDGGAGGAGGVFRIQTNGTAFAVIKSFPLGAEVVAACPQKWVRLPPEPVVHQRRAAVA
jgi:uncharacterized repeat protein (TIGR03803 family)